MKTPNRPVASYRREIEEMRGVIAQLQFAVSQEGRRADELQAAIDKVGMVKSHAGRCNMDDARYVTVQFDRFHLRMMDDPKAFLEYVFRKASSQVLHDCGVQQ
jgi:hypothetical protein